MEEKRFDLIENIETFTKQSWIKASRPYMASPYKVNMTYKGHVLEYYSNTWDWQSYCIYFRVDNKTFYHLDSKSDLSKEEIQQLKLKAFEYIKSL